MSDRRRSPLARQLLGRLPKFIRFPLMRRQLRISTDLDPKFKFRIARTQEELSQAYRILHDSYVEMGYSEPQISGMRIIKYFALPTTTTLIAYYGDQVVGTISIIRRGAFGLPMESVFDLTRFIEKNEVIAEVSSLAIDAKFRQKRGALFLPLCKYFWEYICHFMNLDGVVITVNPSMADFYEGFLCFETLPKAKVSSYDFANGAPGIGLYLNVRKAPEAFGKIYSHLPKEKDLLNYFINVKFDHFEFPDRKYYKSSDPVMSPRMLEFFFRERSSVMTDLKDQEKMALAALYPFQDYQYVLPPTKALLNRNNIRFSVKMKAQTGFSSDWGLSVLDVGETGLCVASQSELSGIVLLRVQVAWNRVAEVRGEVKWSDPAKKVYGLRLMNADEDWNGLIRYLENDFAEIVDVARIKAA